MRITQLVQFHGVPCARCSQDGVVPEDTDGFRALLGGDQAELHSDGFVQIVLQQLVVVVDRDTDHRRVDDWTLRHTDDDSNTGKT